MSEKENISRFGFSMEEKSSPVFEWDERIMRRSKSLWGSKSVETSIKFVETYE